MNGNDPDGPVNTWPGALESGFAALRPAFLGQGRVFAMDLASGEWSDLGWVSATGLVEEVVADDQRAQDRWRMICDTLRPYVGRPVTEVAEELGIRPGAEQRPAPDPAMRIFPAVSVTISAPAAEAQIMEQMRVLAAQLQEAPPPMQGWVADITGRRPADADPLEQIDRALNQLCPCGAEPSEEFHPYCSYDCKPNYRSVHTSSDTDGTQMRWRPDLVSEAGDEGLTVRLPRQRHGRWWVEVFDRAGMDVDTLHVRVDDDNRWVGADLPLEPEVTLSTRYADKLRALIRELEDTRRTVPAAVEEQAYADAVAMRVRLGGAELYPRDSDHIHLASGYSRHGRAVDWPPSLGALSEALRSMQRPAAGAGQALARMREVLRRAGLYRDPEPERPSSEQEVLRRALDARRDRTHGPAQNQRAPRRIDPRRGR